MQNGKTYLDAGALEWFDDFIELSSDRSVQVGMSETPYIGPIPASSINTASGKYPGEESTFKRMMRAMDNAYLEMARRPKDEPKIDLSRNFGPGDMRALMKG